MGECSESHFRRYLYCRLVILTVCYKRKFKLVLADKELLYLKPLYGGERTRTAVAVAYKIIAYHQQSALVGNG